MRDNRFRSLGREEARRALDQLWVLFKRRGKGTIKWVQEELSLARNALYSWRSRKQLRYSDLIAILLLLDQDPGTFLKKLFPATGTNLSHPPANDSHLDLLLRSWDNTKYRDPFEALNLLAKHERTFGDHWSYCLAIGSTLRLLEIWRKAEYWINRASSFSPDRNARARCLIRLCPIITHHRNNPLKSIKLVEDQIPFLSGAERALANHYKALAFRAHGDLSSCVRNTTRVLCDPEASSRTVVSSWQTLGLALLEAGDLAAGRRCIRNALPMALDCWTKGHVMWALSRMLPASEASIWYDAAFEVLGDGLLFESFRLVIERFNRVGFEPHLFHALVARCKSRNNLFIEITQELEASAQLDSRNVSQLLKELSLSWERWKRAQLRRFQL